ncbi:MAG TPA: hypothetical protein VLJ39_15105 [Tepidisphaeraceae bacterium]|jgi:hypothetical protein|nr:hypothetical protein [Tepidisphaeraceae bacterium]
MRFGETYIPGSAPEETSSAAAQIAGVLAENRELRAQVEQLRAERKALLDIQQSVVGLLGAKSPDRIVHDLRNVINERDLLKTLVDEM